MFSGLCSQTTWIHHSLSTLSLWLPFMSLFIVKIKIVTSLSFDEFCCVWDMSSMDGDAEAAVTARICSGQFKCRSLASFLTAKDVSLLLRGKVFHACVRREVRRGR